MVSFLEIQKNRSTVNVSRTEVRKYVVTSGEVGELWERRKPKSPSCEGEQWVGDRR